MDVGMYERALERTGRVVAGTGREQLEDPTPCTDWTVRDLLNHIIVGCLTLAAGVSGEPFPPDDTDHCAEDHVDAFDRAAKGALEAFREPGVLERELKMPWGDTPGSAALGLALADAAVHGWDLATATGQEAAIDADIAETVYGMTSRMMEPMGPYPRGTRFGEPIAVAAGASAEARLLGYLGRRP